MNTIRPVSDLRDDPDSILRDVHETSQPVFLTEKGYGDVVVMSMDAYEDMRLESEMIFKILESERAEAESDETFTPEEVLVAAKKAARGEL